MRNVDHPQPAQSGRPDPDPQVTSGCARAVVLPPEAESVSAARSLLRELLTEIGRTDWVDAAELAISELVTNAALHAHTAIEVLVDADSERVRVEVRDYSTLLPAQRRYDTHATTGRGMALVALVARDCGVIELGPDGKVVWFEVGDPDGEASAGEMSIDWELDDFFSEDGHPATDEPQVVDVQLIAMPPTLYLAASQHHDALLRELVLYCASHADVDVDFPRADQARRLVSDALDEAIEAAQRAGLAEPAVPHGHPSPLPPVPRQIDLQLQVPTDYGRSFEMLAESLDAAERLAAADRLLVYPGCLRSSRCATGSVTR